MTKEEAKVKIVDLIKKYERVKDTGQISKYSEADTRREFIMPFFEALGWDVYNNFGRDVKEEVDVIRKRVDYQFLVGNIPKFFLEAKALKEDLDRVEWAKQAVTYGWNKNIPWVILTDFEGLKLFNSEWKVTTPKANLEFSYKDYLDRFDKLWLFSKESIEKGELDKLATEWGILAKRINVDKKLADDLIEWRKILFKNFRQWNSEMKEEDLDEAIQRILDRLIFIRVCEDRQLEPSILWPALQKWLQQGRKPYNFMQMLTPLFREFDERYNSNLFQPHFCEQIDTEGEPFKQIINDMYASKEEGVKYRFDAINADVLGSIYEQYLGYVQTKIEGDKSKRKSQGIYYTPTFIVDYIVRTTLKPVLDNCKSVADLKKIKILDPACGSGSFLIKALEVILEKYVEFNYKDDQNTKIMILQDNIYGVDLDEQAVEIARLNLLISVLGDRIKLPSLTKNIQQGNSLISGTDNELQKYFGKTYRDKKPFNWKEEFPDVFKQGGFNVVIGNPPYIFTRENIEENEKKFYLDKYILTEFKLNTYILFIEKAYNLLNERGSLGFIVPNNWLTLEMNSRLRKFILEKTFNIQIVNVKDKVFGSANVDNCVLSFTKTGNAVVRIGEMDLQGFHHTHDTPSVNFLSNHGHLITYSSEGRDEATNIFKKISKISVSLDEITEVKNGVQAYTVGEGKPKQTEEMKENRVYHGSIKIDDTWIKYVDGVDVSRYHLGWSKQFIKYGENLSRQRRPELFEGKRILVRQIPAKHPHSIHAVYTDENLVNDNNSMIIKFKADYKEYDIFYILGIINSSLISFWFNYTFGKLQRKIFPQFKVNELARFPINPADRRQQKTIVELVDRILKLNKQFKDEEINSNQWNTLKAEIEKIDKKIDDEVYKLYGLKPEETAIVEKS